MAALLDETVGAELSAAPFGAVIAPPEGLPCSCGRVVGSRLTVPLGRPREGAL